MQKQHRPSLKHLLLYFLWFVVGILLGYYLGYDHGWEKVLYGKKYVTPTPTCTALTNISPQAGEKVTSPLTVTVTVDNTKSCRWTVFEAQAGTLELKDSTGQVVGTGILTTTEEWMTEQPVEYSGTVEFTTPSGSELLLTITEEDPGGEGSQTVSIPLTY